MKRNMCALGMLLMALCAMAPAFSAEEAPVLKGETPEMRAARTAAAHRTRRIILNNDGNDARGIREGEAKTPESFLARRTTALAGSQVDVIFYCTGVFNLYTHKSDETELRGHGDKLQLDWAWELTQQETDSLMLITQFAHAHNMEAFWSMRMNDTHDSADDALLCQWKQQHLDYLMGEKGKKYPHGGGRWSAVNYGLPEVRDKVFNILRDVATRYDIDGLELDFYRHPFYFQPQLNGDPVTDEHCALMTDLLRRVRAMTVEVAAKRGRPMLIAVRIPDSQGFAKAIGLDIETWLREGLVDIVTGGCYFQFEPWENLVALGHRYNVPVYAGLSASRIRPQKPGDDDTPLWHACAARAWRAGVDGIYLFNRFNPNDPLFRVLGDPALVAEKEGVPSEITGEPKAMNRWLKGGADFLKLPPIYIKN